MFRQIFVPVGMDGRIWGSFHVWFLTIWRCQMCRCFVYKVISIKRSWQVQNSQPVCRNFLAQSYIQQEILANLNSNTIFSTVFCAASLMFLSEFQKKKVLQKEVLHNDSHLLPFPVSCVLLLPLLLTFSDHPEARFWPQPPLLRQDRRDQTCKNVYAQHAGNSGRRGRG